MNISKNKSSDVDPNQQDMRELENLYNSRQFNSLENRVKQLLKKYPKNTNLHNILGIALKDQWKLTDSIEIFEKAIKIQPNFYIAYHNMGNVLQDLCRLDEAKTCYQKCIGINPNYIEAYISLGKILLDFNKLDESAAIFKRALKLKPENAKLHRHLSEVTKYKKNDSQTKDMERIISNSNATQDQQMHLSFALGKVYEDMKCYDKAFSHWEKGNFLKRKEIKYSTNSEARLFQIMKKTFTKALFEKFGNYGNLENTLIFIIGMPRSGTTLVQQILSSHPKVLGTGESNQLSNIIGEYFFEESGFLKKDLHNYNPVNFSKIGDDYIKNPRQFSENIRHILVKDLLNFKWLGFIKLIFPNAKIIHCVRNPLDNCVSLFKHLFTGGVDFSYNLVELGEYYNLYQDIMLFWDKILPNYYINIFYEELINNQKEQTEKLLNACNLEWDENCMQFFKNKYFMSTGSNSINIHQPIYKTSIQSWKRYEKQLQPLIEVLKT